MLEYSCFIMLCQFLKVTQSCLTLCDPTDYTVPGILQARILERVCYLRSHDRLFVTPWTIACQAPLSVEFSSRLPFPSSTDLPNPGTEPWSPALQAGSLSSEPTWKPTGVDNHSFLQGIFPAQGSNPGLPHCMWILYQLSHQGSSCQVLLVLQSQSVIHMFVYPLSNIDSVLKRNDILLPTKVQLVKVMVVPVIMYRCESWTIKKVD